MKSVVLKVELSITSFTLDQYLNHLFVGGITIFKIFHLSKSLQRLSIWRSHTGLASGCTVYELNTEFFASDVYAKESGLTRK